jgi:hypothetical protein
MRVTGWDTATLRRQPARVIRAHFLRIFVGLAWNPALAEAAAGPPPARSSFGTLSDYAAARGAKARAQIAFTELQRALWPEDE